MSRIDWPHEFERTPAPQRERTSKFSATRGQTGKQLGGEMGRMNVDSWRVSTASGGGYTKSNGLPKSTANPDDPGFVLRWSKAGEQFAVACDAYVHLDDNMRAVYLWVRETRLRGNRPVKTGDSEFAAARLPPGDKDSIATRPPAHEVLEVAPNADPQVVKAAAKQKKAKAHPDAGGDEAAFKRVVEAEEAMLDE